MRKFPPAFLFQFFCLSSLVFAADPSLVMDLRTTETSEGVLTRVFGRGMENGGSRGVPVTGGFDCDGDGFRDFAFAQMQGSPFGRVGAGEVTLIFGDGTIGGTIDSSMIQSQILRIAGTQGRETTGDEIWMDDLNGDGLGDLIIGRQNHSPDENRPGAGAVTIIFGGPELKTHAEGLAYLDLANIPAEIDTVTFLGSSAYDRLGIWMRTGDISGDGVSDMVVGADEVDGAGLAVSDNRGSAFVIRGGAFLDGAPEIIDLEDFGTANFPDTVSGNVAQIDPPESSAGYHFGATVLLADLDGNNRMEVLVSAALERSGAGLRLPNAPSGTGQSFGGSANGSVFIVWDENFPETEWPAGYRFSAISPPIGDFTRIDGSPINGTFGEELIGGLDFSGDGFNDLFVGDLIGSPGDRVSAGVGFIIYNAANLRGQSFRINTPPAGVVTTVIYGPDFGAIGADTAAQGDFDNDGFADLAIGNPHDGPDSRFFAGSVHVLYGQPGGWPQVVDLRPDTDGLPSVFPGPEVVRIAHIWGANGTSGDNTGDTLCYSGDAADIDGDGKTDLIINEMVGDGLLADDVGNLIIISGDALLETPAFNLSTALSGPLNFWTRDQPGSEDRRMITVTNTNPNSLTIESVSISGPNTGNFSIVSQSGETVLAQGESKSIELSFSSSSLGYRSAALVVETNLDPIPFRVGLAGVATEETVGFEDLVLNLNDQAITLQYDSESLVTYLFQKSDDLSDWSTQSIQSGDGSEITLIDQNPFDENLLRVFYRLLAIPRD